MREQLRAREGSFGGDLHRGGLGGRLYSDESVREAPGQDLEARGRQRSRTGGRSGTTHISVVDERGNAASLTASIGSGSGVIVPGTGVHMKHARRVRPQSGGPEGSSGSAPDEHDGAVARPRSRAAPAGRGQRGLDQAARAIMQIVSTSSVTDCPLRRRSRRRASTSTTATSIARVARTRLELDELERLGYELVRWRRRTSTSAAQQPSSGSTTGVSPRQGILAGAGMGSSSHDERLDDRQAGSGRRRRGARRHRACVAAEDELWLTYDRNASASGAAWRMRRDTNTAVFVAETPTGVVGRLSIGRVRHPYSHHVAELGLMVAPASGAEASARR